MQSSHNEFIKKLLIAALRIINDLTTQETVFGGNIALDIYKAQHAFRVGMISSFLKT